MAHAEAFGVAVAVPEGWTDESVFVWVAPAPARSGPRSTAQQPPRPMISAARLDVPSMEEAIARLGPFVGDGADVLVDEMRDDDGAAHYERVGRFADPMTGAPVQQAARVYHKGNRAVIVLLTTPAIEFNLHYTGFASIARSLGRGAL